MLRFFSPSVTLRTTSDLDSLPLQILFLLFFFFFSERILGMINSYQYIINHANDNNPRIVFITDLLAS